MDATTKHAGTEDPAMEAILSALNPPQRMAVETLNGPVLILAGAGSGKTKALTHRIAALIHQGVPAWQILAVTFTNKAADEMKHRIRNLLHITEGETLPSFASQTAKLPVMGTFHSICARILRKDIDKLGRDRSFTIYDQDDQEKLMKQVLKELSVEESELKPRAAISYIGQFKSEGLSPKEAQKHAGTARMEQVIKAYARFEQELRKANAVDFDDLILETVRLFHEVPQVLERYQNTWKYLNVDEYQDTNHAQYLFVTLLAKKEHNLCVIGDPDQSIYSFRGADIRNILEFRKEYPQAVEIKLEQNYRSTQTVLSAAEAVISVNPNRPEKKMWSKRTEGPNVTVNEVSDERKEAEEALMAVKRRKHDGTPFNDQVILYRTNAQSRILEEACMRTGTPYRIIGGVKFYARREVKDVLAYLHVILNPQDTVSLLRIINVPARKIGETTIGRLHEHASLHRFSLWETLRAADQVEDLNEGVIARIRKFTEVLDSLTQSASTLVVSDLTQKLLEKTDMERWLKDGSEEGETRWQNVQELLSVTHRYDTLDPHTSLVSFLEEVALVSEVDKLTAVQDDALTLMTLHLCKGLEFEHVVIAGCEEGIFPHANSLFDKEQLEEERRIMYVGMTRAKTHLTLMCARSRMLFGSQQNNAQSRFLSDLPNSITDRRSDSVLSAFAWASESGSRQAVTPKGGPIEPFRQHEVALEFNQDFEEEEAAQEAFEEGVRVEHPTFGCGTVVARRGGIVSVLFDSGKKKDLALSIAPLKVV